MPDPSPPLSSLTNPQAVTACGGSPSPPPLREARTQSLSPPATAAPHCSQTSSLEVCAHKSLHLYLHRYFGDANFCLFFCFVFSLFLIQLRCVSLLGAVQHAGIIIPALHVYFFPHSSCLSPSSYFRTIVCVCSFLCPMTHVINIYVRLINFLEIDSRNAFYFSFTPLT